MPASPASSPAPSLSLPPASPGTGRRIAVVGAGITGVMTAHALAADGHEVVVYEALESVAPEGSFANAGLLSAGSVSPAAAPGLRRWLLRGLVGHEAALRWRPGLAPAQWRWLLRWWRACEGPHARDVRSMVRLARHSQDCLAALTRELGLTYEHSRGVLLLLQHEREFRPSRRHVTMLRELGVPAEECTPARCRELEPGLGEDAPLAGGVHLPDDGVGNCRQFAHQLRDALEQRHGVRFRFNTPVRQLHAEAGGVRLTLAAAPRAGVPAAPDEVARHDAVVLCTGAAGAPLFKSLGWAPPLLPVYGHALTLPQHPEGRLPRSAVVDAQTGIAITRLGPRVRVAGGFALGHRPQADEAALRPLWAALDRWFPYAAQRRDVQVWTGARPMLPGGPPIIGPCPGTAATVWLNLGHGAHGWTLAAGSARLLADQLAGRAGEIDPRRFAVPGHPRRRTAAAAHP